MDIDNVIKGLEKLLKELGYGLPDRSNVVMEYIDSITGSIAIMKDQEEQISIKTENFNRLMARIRVQPEIVRRDDGMPDKKRVEFIESYIKHGAGDYEWSDNHGELVRCNECKHGRPCHDGKVYCENDIGTFESAVHDPDWFCADGERREDDA